MKSKDRLNQTNRQFVQDIQDAFHEIVSIILYGSAVTDDYDPKKSDLNFMVVLNDDEMKQLHRVQPYVKKWEKQKISLPLFVTRSYILQSLDSFPLEFFNIQSAYRVLDGEDVLKDLKFDKKDMRLQCERELKGKLLKLRQGYIFTAGKDSALKGLIASSLVTFVAIFKGLLFIQGVDKIPGRKSEVLLAACDAYKEIDRALFETLLLVRNGQVKKSKTEMESLCQLYIQSVAALSETVDSM